MVEVGGAHAAKEESQYVKVVFFLNHASHSEVVDFDIFLGTRIPSHGCD